MTHRINTVEGRAKLKPRRSPYWARLSSGCQLGYRRMTSASSGSWIAQIYDPGTGRQIRRSLGTFDHLPPNQRYDAAKKEAEGVAARVGRGGQPRVLTVRMACERY